ncbi:Homeo [Glarea lozoyensis ATCC 20868]|uniref:Homeo n=1 Tax=Glarea lozoyensis (strain ATCC 20868 / MF5171) TaxID=1116229 RepID=S3DCD1_GLAL2|nr:Homeo [Glarea lozoyensis ATCC 20868]EPE24308.1 Homeo [Glarea lozoyensis ATCC 20868]
MFTTIEPRLIALLNDEPLGCPPSSLELPPLQDPNILKASGRPLLLEPGTSTRNVSPASTCNTQRTSRTIEPDIVRDETGKDSERCTSSERTLGVTSPQSLRKILSEDVGTTITSTSKKRSLVEASKDDFVQLPQPPKKQRATKQVVPPIIIGLFEPPPQATLFPPIASSSFHDSHGRNTLNTVSLPVNGVEQVPKPVVPADLEGLPAENKAPKKKKEPRTRKRWTDEETNNLLLGVKKHGLGCWTDILEDPAFSFNRRSAADLKDRFRTCCPKELRGETTNGNPLSAVTEDLGLSAKPLRSKSSLLSENILIDDEELQNNLKTNESSAARPKKTRTHRKKLEDLAQLGIEGPFRKSNRRERRAFSAEEDRNILLGYQLHGPAWTKIQRDPQFNLITRQPTDLRDRFRNKYPERFRSEDKSEPTGKLKHSFKPSCARASIEVNPKSTVIVESNFNNSASQMSLPSPVRSRTVDKSRDHYGKENDDTIPSHTLSNLPTSGREGLRIQQIISQDSGPSSQSSTAFKDNIAAFAEATATEQGEVLPFTQSFDWNASMAAPFNTNMGEMDISRLLLDESWIDHPLPCSKDRQNMSDIDKASMAANADGLPNSSFSYLLGESEESAPLEQTVVHESF